jgi:hypothetical protein
MTEQMTWMGMQMRMKSTNSSPTSSDVPGSGDLRQGQDAIEVVFLVTY